MVLSWTRARLYVDLVSETPEVGIISLINHYRGPVYTFTGGYGIPLHESTPM